jgi:hypothetical protein
MGDFGAGAQKNIFSLLASSLDLYSLENEVKGL